MNLATFKQSAYVIALAALMAGCSSNASPNEEEADPIGNGSAANSNQTAGDAGPNVSERLAGDAGAGKASFAQCSSCHSDQPGEHRTGPSLAGIVGTPSGSIEGFTYSPASVESEVVWTEENLDAFLANPRDVISQTRMIFPGISDPKMRADIVAYLATLE